MAARANWSVLNRPSTTGSDHCPTVVSIDELEVEIDDDYLPTFNMSKADWSKFKQICADSFLTDIEYADRDVNDIYNNIVRIIVFAAEECIPQTKTRRFKKRLP